MNFDFALAIGCTGLAVLLFVFVGWVLARRMWRQYEQEYIEGAAVTLDAMFITMPAQNILYLGILCSLVLGTITGIVSGSITAGLITGFVGLPIPRLWLFYLKKSRDKLFIEQLVDALMSMSNSLRAGFSLTQALELVYREMPNPISQEIRVVCHEMRLGLPIDDALNGLLKRMPSRDLDLMVTAISIVRDVGGNLTEVFDNIAHTIRERQRIEGKIQTLTAQGRLQAIVMCLMPFGLAALMCMVADLYLLFFTSLFGIIVLICIAVYIGIGALVIRKIMQIDV